MISENARDLVNRITTLPALEASTGLALGGKGTDPGMLKVPLPAAWVMFTTDDAAEAPFGNSGYQPGLVSESQVMSLTFHVLVYIPYISQEDLLNVQFPLLESIARTVHAKPAPSGHRWRYLGQKLALVYPDRIGYEQHYTLTAVL